MKSPRIALYARVSTTDKGQDTEVQLTQLRDYCQRQGWNQWTEYIDHVSSAKTRPRLNDLMQDCYHGKVDVVLCWKLDRFSRSTKEFLLNVTQLDQLKIRFIATSQNIDTDQSNPISKLIMHVLASVAEFEREIIKERVNAGIALARMRGVAIGRPKVKHSPALQQAISRVAAGESITAVARETGISRRTLDRKVKENGLSSNNQ